MRTRRIWNWKRLGFLFALAGAHALFAESKSLHSFEDWKWDYPQGIGFWADSESKKPAFERSEEAVDGKYALQVEFFGCKKFQGINIGTLQLPPDARYITFQLKLVSGRMPNQIELEEKRPGASVPERFITSFSPPAPGRYQRVILPLEKFRFLRGEGDGKLDIANPLVMILPGYTADGAVFLIDDVRAESELPAENDSNQVEPPPETEGVNLLPGDCSFESGPGGWVFWESAHAPRIASGDAADGDSALLLPPRHRAMTPMFYQLRDPASEYVISFSAKSTGQGILELHLWGAHWQYLCGKEFPLTAEWQRYSLRVPAGKEQITDLRIHFHTRETTVLLDSVQFEKGSTPSGYVPSFSVATRFTTGFDGELLCDNELPVRMRGRIHNASAVPRRLIVSAKHAGKIFFSRQMELAPFEAAAVEFDCPFARGSGYYPVKIAVADDVDLQALQRFLVHLGFVKGNPHIQVQVLRQSQGHQPGEGQVDGLAQQGGDSPIEGHQDGQHQLTLGGGVQLVGKNPLQKGHPAQPVHQPIARYGRADAVDLGGTGEVHGATSSPSSSWVSRSTM